MKDCMANIVNQQVYLFIYLFYIHAPVSLVPRKKKISLLLVICGLCSQMRHFWLRLYLRPLATSLHFRWNLLLMQWVMPLEFTQLLLHCNSVFKTEWKCQNLNNISPLGQPKGHIYKNPLEILSMTRHKRSFFTALNRNLQPSGSCKTVYNRFFVVFSIF